MVKNCRHKKCSQVNPQPIDNFSINVSGRKGRYSLCRVCKNKTAQQRYHENQGIHRSRLNSIARKYWPHLSSKDGIEEYEKLMILQENKCKICDQNETEKDSKYNTIKHLTVDHHHGKGHVRGLLCGKCNRGLGQLLDSAELCLKAYEYLLKNE